MVLEQIPRRFEHDGRFFELDYLPIWEDRGATEEVLDEVLVVVHDVTSRVERERAEQAQRGAMNVFRRILDDRAGFHEFFRDATRLVDTISRSLVGPVDPTAIARDIHTLKGNTAVYGIESVSQLCHEIESRLHDEGGVPSAAEVAQMCAAWASVCALADQLGFTATRTTIELGAAEYEEHVRSIANRLPHGQLLRSVQRWANELASVRLERIAEQARSIALRLGKGGLVVDISATPSTLRLPADRWAPFWSVFTHVLRNTLDHGIEAAKDRTAQGKPAAGNVQLVLSTSAAGVEMRVTDDGRGIAWGDDQGPRSGARAAARDARRSRRVALRRPRLLTGPRPTRSRAVGSAWARFVRSCTRTAERITLESRAGEGTTMRFPLPAGHDRRRFRCGARCPRYEGRLATFSARARWPLLVPMRSLSHVAVVKSDAPEPLEEQTAVRRTIAPRIEDATRVEVDLDAVRTNLRSVKARVGARTGVLAVLKADAYGHGAVAVSRALESDGVVAGFVHHRRPGCASAPERGHQRPDPGHGSFLRREPWRRPRCAHPARARKRPPSSNDLLARRGIAARARRST